MDDLGRLLVVDGGKLPPSTLGARLARAGCDVTEARDGSQALALIERQHFDVVVLDLSGVDGLDVLKTLRQTYSMNALPVTVVIEVKDNEHIVKAIELGANHYMSHPVNFDVLLARIKLQLAQKREQALLAEQASRDPLTNLYNRRHLTLALRRELKRAERYGHPLTLLMLDLDGFKQINDSLGHPKGDEVLQQISRVFNDTVRDTDMVFRYGGDEFLIMLVETNGESVYAIKRLKAAVAAWVKEAQLGCPLGLSVGSVMWQPGMDPDTDALLRQADQLLYSEKHDKASKKLAQELVAKRDQLTQVQQFLDRLNTGTQLSVMLQRLLEELVALLPHADSGSALLLNEESGLLEFVAAVGWDLETLRRISVPKTFEDPRVKPSGTSGVVSQQAYTDFNRKHWNKRDAKRLEQLGLPLSSISVPIKANDEVVGHLNLDSRNVENAFSESDVMSVHTLLPQIELAVKRARELNKLERYRQRLAESEARFKALFTHSPALLHSCNEQGHILDVSDGWLGALGYARDEVIGHRPQEFLTPACREHVEAIELPKFDRLGVLRDVPHQFVKKDGTVVEVLLSSHVERDKEGHFLRTHTVLVDITEKKRVEEVLRNRGRFLTRAQKIARLGFITWDLATNAMYWSDEIYRIYGLKRREVEASVEQALAGVHPEDKARVNEDIDLAVRGVKEYDCFHRVVRPDGSVCHVHAQAEITRDAEGNAVHMLGTVLDVTEYERTQATLRTLEQAVEQTGCAVLVADIDGKLEYVNAMFSLLTGYTSREALGHMPGELFKLGETSPTLYKELWQTISSGRTWKGEFRGKKKNGELFWSAATITPVKDQRGTITHYVGVQEDITSWKAAQQKQLALTAKLEKSEERFHKAFATSPDAININRMRDGLYVEVNRGFTEITGYTAADVLGKTSHDINIWHNPKDREWLVKALLNTGRVTNFEAQFRLKDGRVVTALMSACLIELDGEPHIISITRDIEALKREHRANERLKTHLEHIVEISKDGIITTDENQRITLFNRGAENIFGYTRDEILGQPLDVLLPKHLRKIHPQLIREFVASSTDHRFFDERDETLLGLRKDGTAFPIEASIAKFKVGSEQVFMARVRDVTNKRMRQHHEVQLQRELEQAAIEMATMLSKTIDEKDSYTAGHCRRLARCCKTLGEKLGLDKARLSQLNYAALLHDVGKVGVPESVLCKPSKLTPEEWVVMRSHVDTGAKLVEGIHTLKRAARIVAQHHESWDGKGYPNGLKGEDILLEARILSVADAFDAMTTDRPYRKALSVQEAIDELRRCAGQQWDPTVVEALLEVVMAV